MADMKANSALRNFLEVLKAHNGISALCRMEAGCAGFIQPKIPPNRCAAICPSVHSYAFWDRQSYASTRNLDSGSAGHAAVTRCTRSMPVSG